MTNIFESRQGRPAKQHGKRAVGKYDAFFNTVREQVTDLSLPVEERQYFKFPVSAKGSTAQAINQGKFANMEAGEFVAVTSGGEVWVTLGGAATTPAKTPAKTRAKRSK